MAYEDLPAEVRRANWGWFGAPWPSGVCYLEDGELNTEMRKPFPEDESCAYCETPFQAGDSGKAMPYPDGIRHVHKECLLRQVTGPLAHLDRKCSCFGGTSSSTPGMSLRQEALEVWNRWHPGSAR